MLRKGKGKYKRGWYRGGEGGKGGKNLEGGLWIGAESLHMIIVRMEEVVCNGSGLMCYFDILVSIRLD